MDNDRPRRSSVSRMLALRVLSVVTLIAGAMLAYLALPEDIKTRMGLPESIVSEDLAWQWVSMQDTQEGYQWFLRHWPSGSNAIKVARKLEDLAWTQASKLDQYEDYVSYVAAFPKGAYAAIARSTIEERLWQRITAIGREGSYRAYLEDYPNGRYAQQAAQALKTKSGERPR